MEDLDSWLLPLFQERIFLTVSNYIFTAIFVGEMTLKVVGFTSILPTPTWSPWLRPHLSCWPGAQQHPTGPRGPLLLGSRPWAELWDERGSVPPPFSNYQTQLEGRIWVEALPWEAPQCGWLWIEISSSCSETIAWSLPWAKSRPFTCPSPAFRRTIMSHTPPITSLQEADLTSRCPAPRGSLLAPSTSQGLTLTLSPGGFSGPVLRRAGILTQQLECTGWLPGLCVHH